MALRSKSVFLLGCFAAVAWPAASSFARQAATDAPFKVVVIKGLPGVKDNTKGTLIVGDGSMHFCARGGEDGLGRAFDRGCGDRRRQPAGDSRNGRNVVVVRALRRRADS